MEKNFASTEFSILNNNQKRNKIIVTGASGFIGSNLVLELCKMTNCHIVGIDWCEKTNKILLEGEKIRQRIFDYEQDRWVY